jgi:lipopolysaccharide biosynthesis regulator YciM
VPHLLLWRRILCTTTPLRRYACQDCGYHGWTFVWLAPPPNHHPQRATVAAKP